jgi:hypothetical protein
MRTTGYGSDQPGPTTRLTSLLGMSTRGLPPGARRVLLAPGAVTSALAAADGDPERRWMLRLPREVRRSFVRDVIDQGGGRAAQERWVLLQDDRVRESYVESVLLASVDPDPRELWMLRQARAVRESYVHEVVDAGVDGED